MPQTHDGSIEGATPTVRAVVDVEVAADGQRTVGVLAPTDAAQPALTPDPTDNALLIVSGSEQADRSVGSALNELLLRVSVRKYKADLALESAAQAKHEVVNTLRRGATLTAANPLRPEQEIAQVNVSKSTWTAKTVDRSASEEWVKARYADRVEKKTRILGTDQDVLNILRTFAPYLLEEVDVVPDHVIRELELKSERARQPMGWGGEVGDDAPPGIEVTQSDPKVTITFREVEAIDDLILDGVIDLDGNMLGGAL